MATPERPKSRLPDGRINPEYTAWRNKYVLKAKAQQPPPREVAVMIGQLSDLNVSPVEDAPDTSNAVLTMDVGEDVPDPDQPEILTLRCIKQAVNQRYVYCDLNGRKVPVKVKKGIGHRLVKKPIKVSVDRSSETPVYTHVR